MTRRALARNCGGRAASGAVGARAKSRDLASLTPAAFKGDAVPKNRAPSPIPPALKKWRRVSASDMRAPASETPGVVESFVDFFLDTNITSSTRRQGLAARWPQP